MNAHRLIAGTVATLLSGVALAGSPVSLGASLGSALGVSLGSVLGSVLGISLGLTPLPITGGSLLFVAAASLVAGILIVRRKKRH